MKIRLNRFSFKSTLIALSAAFFASSTAHAEVLVSDETLFIVGDAASQYVEIIDRHDKSKQSAILTYDADGDGSFDGPDDFDGVNVGRILTFIIELDEGDDTVEFKVDHFYKSVDKAIHVDLGEGNNTFSLDKRRGVIDFVDATVNLEIHSDGGEDTIDVRLPDSWLANDEPTFFFSMNVLENMGDEDKVTLHHQKKSFSSVNSPNAPTVLQNNQKQFFAVRDGKIQSTKGRAHAAAALLDAIFVGGSYTVDSFNGDIFTCQDSCTDLSKTGVGQSSCEALCDAGL